MNADESIQALNHDEDGSQESDSLPLTARMVTSWIETAERQAAIAKALRELWAACDEAVDIARTAPRVARAVAELRHLTEDDLDIEEHNAFAGVEWHVTHPEMSFQKGDSGLCMKGLVRHLHGKHAPRKSGYRWYMPTDPPGLPVIVHIRENELLGIKGPWEAGIIAWRRYVPCFELDAVGVWGPWIEQWVPEDMPDMAELVG